MKSIDSSSSEPIAGEQELVRQAQADDENAFARLYDAYLARIYRYVYFRVTDDQIAEDITSQVFLKAWENLKRYQIGSSPFVSWLYRIARNAVIDHYRTHRSTIALEEVTSAHADSAEDLDEQIDRHFEARELRLALQQLTGEQQQVLILKFIAGLSTPEIARQMGKRQGAIRALQMRALQSLAKTMG
ncbi:MAG: sigma-70 family RNA polymerase sigma factor [Chloroflexota bacterium]